MCKDMEARLIAEAHRLGLDNIYVDRGRRHYRLYTSFKGLRCKFVVFAKTPSDHRALKNTIKTLRDVARDAKQLDPD